MNARRAKEADPPGLRVHRGGLGVGGSRQGEQEAGDEEHHRRHTEGVDRHEPEGVVDGAAHVAVGGGEQRARAEHPFETLVLGPALGHPPETLLGGGADLGPFPPSSRRARWWSGSSAAPDDMRRALFSSNHANWYVEKVLPWPRCTAARPAPRVQRLRARLDPRPGRASSACCGPRRRSTAAASPTTTAAATASHRRTRRAGGTAGTPASTRSSDRLTPGWTAPRASRSCSRASATTPDVTRDQFTTCGRARPRPLGDDLGRPRPRLRPDRRALLGQVKSLLAAVARIVGEAVGALRGGGERALLPGDEGEEPGLSRPPLVLSRRRWPAARSAAEPSSPRSP